MNPKFKIVKSMIKEKDTLTVELFGSLTVDTSDEFYDTLKGELDDVRLLILDLELLAYITSAGIRSLFRLFQQMTAQEGKIVVRHVNSEVMNIFELMNVVSLVTIED